MTTEIYDKIVLKLEYEGESGSGVLCLDSKEEEVYLITAWHCLGKNKEINSDKIKTYRQINAEIEEIKLEFKSDPLILEKEDIAILTLADLTSEGLEDIPACSMIELKKKEDINILGFPKALGSQECRLSRLKLNGDINELPGKDIIQIDSKRPLETYLNNARGTLSGCSGSPIFMEYKDEVFLVGIITDLGAPDGAFGSILGVTIARIDEEIKKKTGKHLFDIQLCDFSKFQKGIETIFDDELKRICLNQIRTIKDNVKPKSIIEEYGEKIIWPYSYLGKNNRKLWENWLFYLVVRCIESKDNMLKREYCIIRNEEIERKVKLLYTTKYTKLPDFLRDYIQNGYEDIKSRDVIIIGTEDQPPSKTCLPKEKIESIVADISNIVSDDKCIDIDVVKANLQSLSVVHIRNFVEEMEKLDGQGITVSELEKQMSNKLKEVLNGY